MGLDPNLQKIRWLKQQLDNAEDYINELYRLNPNLQLPNGKRLSEVSRATDRDPRTES